jgi:UDP-N-acetylmuramoylalanine-D-glutamate ligase
MEIRNRNIVIIGLGSTGRASCRFFAEQGARIRATDEKPRSMLQDALDELAGLPGGFDLWPYDESILRGADLVVPSPVCRPSTPSSLRPAAGVSPF